MTQRKPETFALTVALIGTLSVLLIFLADLIFSRQRDLEAGERRLQHFGAMMAEHTARAFDAVDILLRETANDLSRNGRDWPQWDALRGWEYVAQRHSRAMPQLYNLAIFDRAGQQRFMSTFSPAPQDSIRETRYFGFLERGEEKAANGPFVDAASGHYVYALGRRVLGDKGSFAGLIQGTIDPAYLQDFCWPNRLSDDFEAVLINAQGLVIASCRPSDLSRQSSLLGQPAEAVLFEGRLRDQVQVPGVTRGRGLIVSLSPVPGFRGLRILTAIPESTVLANWRGRLLELGTLGALVTVVLLVGGLLLRRQVRDMAAMTAQLAASHETLEQRISEATRDLAEERDVAERANKAKSRFLAAASHDLRQPLHALSLFAADLQRQVRSGRAADLPHLAEQVTASARLLGEMLDALLDVSRLDVSGVQADVRPFALNPVLQRLNESCRRNAGDKGIRLRFRPTACWIHSDQVMVERMIGNLISNAIRYTPSGGRVLVAARLRREAVLIEVRDSGIGIAPEHQSAIFAEFYQVGNAAREQNKGLGLGLSIVDRLAKALGASVSLRSRPGEGTSFVIRLPRAAPAELWTEAEVTAAGRLHVIGDSPALMECVGLASRWGYEVMRSGMPAPDAVQIVDVDRLADVRSAGPAIVLLGEACSLPEGMHGLQLPVRPAKLRALLAQLQKTLSKSMP